MLPRNWAMPTSNGRQPALEVLSSRDEQGLHVHVRQPAEQEPPELVPLFGLAEERLDPHGSLR